MYGNIMIQNIINKEDYIGYDVNYILQYLEKTYKGKAHKRFLLLFGKPGTGKTTLIKILQNEKNINFRISNASDTRKISDITEDIYNTSGIDYNRIGVVLDECDGLTKGAWKKITTIAKQNNRTPIILIANNNNLIPENIRKNSIEKQIKVDVFKLRALARRINEKENLNLTIDEINNIADKCQSYRCIINFLKYNYYSDIEIIEKENTQILNVLHGEFIRFKTGDLRNITTIIHDNTRSVELVSQADFWLGRYEHGYTYGKYIANACLNAIRGKKTKLDYPRTYALIHKARNKKGNIKSNKTKQKVPEISIIGIK